MRGLKQAIDNLLVSFRMSHPTWVRGLKLKNTVSIEIEDGVAPYVGAWIETLKSTHLQTSVGVAPYVGAWIETRIVMETIRN